MHWIALSRSYLVCLAIDWYGEISVNNEVKCFRKLYQCLLQNNAAIKVKELNV